MTANQRTGDVDTIPDTTDAVLNALQKGRLFQLVDALLVDLMLEADRKELAEQGYVIVRKADLIWFIEDYVQQPFRVPETQRPFNSTLQMNRKELLEGFGLSVEDTQ